MKGKKWNILVKFISFFLVLDFQQAGFWHLWWSWKIITTVIKFSIPLPHPLCIVSDIACCVVKGISHYQMETCFCLPCNCRVIICMGRSNKLYQNLPKLSAERRWYQFKWGTKWQSQWGKFLEFFTFQNFSYGMLPCTAKSSRFLSY